MIKQNLTLGTTTSKKRKNSGTGGLYGDFVGGTGSANNVSLPNLPALNPTYGDFINIPTPSKDKTGGAYTGNDLTLNPSTPSFGYGDALGDLSVTPKKKDEQIVTPTWGTGNNSKLPPSAPSGISKGDISVAPVDKSQFFDSNVVGTVGGGFSGGKKGGVTNEGGIIGAPNVDNSTFNNIGSSISGDKTPALSDNTSSDTGNFAPAVRNLVENLFLNSKIDPPKYSDYAPAQSTGQTETDTNNTQEKQPTESAAQPEKENGGKMSYEDYINEMKKGYQEQLDAANKQAEQTKARAMADAENAYAQNKATYGTNAETLAQMGLTGGGYSDYLQAQAYAQKRADAQVAGAQEIASKENAQATYQQYISSMNEKLAEKALYEEQLEEQRKYERQQLEEQRKYNEEQAVKEKQQEEAAYAKNAYYSLLSNIQNTAYSDVYSEEGIRALGKMWGWSEEQITDAVNIWNDTKKRADESLSIDGDKNEDTGKVQFTKDAIKLIQNGTFGIENADGTITPFTREQVYEGCLQARNNGDMTDEEVKQIMKEYDRRKLYEEGRLSADEYYNAANKDTAAEKEVDKILNADYYKSKVGSYGYNQKDARDVIFTTSDKFNISQFGDYTGSGHDGKQDNYLKKIVADAKAGKIKEGQYIVANYGSAFSSMGYFLYVGDGVFVKLYDQISASAIDDYNPTKNKGDSLYVPEGYRWKNGKIKKA